MNRPTGLFVNFPGPHDPWDAPGRYATMYDPAHSPPPIPIPERPRTLPDHAAAKLDFAPEPGLTAAVIAAIRANYGGKVSFVDDWCRRIFDAYAARGWLDDLLVIITSDHGEMAGDHGRVYKRTFHESALRVPLILRWPGEDPARYARRAGRKHRCHADGAGRRSACRSRPCPSAAPCCR